MRNPGRRWGVTPLFNFAISGPRKLWPSQLLVACSADARYGLSARRDPSLTVPFNGLRELCDNFKKASLVRSAQRRKKWAEARFLVGWRVCSRSTIGFRYSPFTSHTSTRSGGFLLLVPGRHLIVALADPGIHLLVSLLLSILLGDCLRNNVFRSR